MVVVINQDVQINQAKQVKTVHLRKKLMNKRNVFSLNLFVVELPSWTRSFINDLVNQLLLRLCQDLHIVFGDIAHLGDIQWEYDFFCQ